MDGEVKKRVIVYIDGFNFYYGLKQTNRWRKYYWLDVVNLFEKFMRSDQELIAVKYFSARPTDLGKSLRQNAFFQANQLNPKFVLVLGKYLKKQITCFNCSNIINTYEEKETDVRVTTQIVSDVYRRKCDISIVVSADSDMMPAIEICQQENHPLFVYFPPNQFSTDLNNIGNGAILMRNYEKRFKHSILPDALILSNGFKLTIPIEWKKHQ